MTTGQTTLLHAGGKDQMLMDFGALVDSLTLEGEPKYTMRPTLESLAKILTAQSGGPNKDVALFELSHLVYGVSQIFGSEGIVDFFLDPQKATPQNVRHRLNLTTDALSLEYEGGHFDIRCGRMPVLIALYEFICSMDQFAHYEAINALFETMCAAPLSQKSLKTCTNGLASILRKYRVAYLTSHQADGKFLQLYKFLQDQSETGVINLTDDAVFDFWCLHNTGKDYRGYRTVFDLFCDFAHAHEEADRIRASASAAPLGLDMEAGEVEVSDGEDRSDTYEDWVSPFDTFDEEGLSDIRFFKKKSERTPIEHLMSYGPQALRLPLAFVRYELFGHVQSGITNDLQVGRGVASVKQRMTCEAVASYEERSEECQAILDHVRNLEQSSLHVLSTGQDNVVSLPQVTQEASRKAFVQMKRKGFDENAMDRVDDFQRAAEALVRLERQLARYVSALQDEHVAMRFEADKENFKTQFAAIYEGVIS